MSELTLARPATRPLPQPGAAAVDPHAAADAACAGIRSEALLGEGREVLIHHRGEVYRLRHTRNDKLILTK
jgi:hemin uptake protein HemP